MLNLYKIENCQYDGWDHFDSAVVAANTAEEASKISPFESVIYGNTEYDWSEAWCDSPEFVKVTLIGTAAEDVNIGVIVSSFRAG